MEKDEKHKFTDIYEVTFDDRNTGYDEFIVLLDKLNYSKKVTYNVVPNGHYSENLESLLNRSNDFFGLSLEKRDLLVQPTTHGEKRQTFEKFLNYFNGITLNSQNLVIVDNYIFPKKYNSEYEELLITVFSKCKKLLIVTSNNYNIKLFESIKNKLENVNLTIVMDDSFHDRFYLSDHNGGFVLGTSLNGIFRKTCVIIRLSSTDYLDACKILLKKGIDINNL